MTIPPIAEELCARYLAAFGARHPGGLAGLYLVGSIVLDDFQPGPSDVDFIAVIGHPVGLGEIAPVHAELAAAFPHPYFDGIYVTENELRSSPHGSRGIAVVEGVPGDNSRAERHAVTWLTLARHGIRVRGPAPAAGWIAADPAAAREHARRNLTQYWRTWVDQHRELSTPGGQHGLTVDGVTWSVLGVSRLHATIAEGALLSKSAAGRYAADRFPAHRAIVECALAARRGGDAAFAGGPLARREATLACLDAIIADALGPLR